MARVRSALTRKRINPSNAMREVGDPAAGGTVVFVGTIRNRSEFGRVDGLEYQAYKKMAEKRMKVIAAEVTKKWPVKKVSMYHREGRLGIGEVSVVVAVSSTHRAEAFEACRYAIDRIKTGLPLWKRERVRGTGRWVEGKPIRA
ncbi:MAG TPA: molybdenum cofactor biosynthesis protein MoaE [Nitrososphaerales archaeon]|nr:molybdenum cofactor biosynthesis protein MoaE [Nitrososphaerales archaeon]